MRRKSVYCVICLSLYLTCLSQPDSNIIRIDFNDHGLKELNDRIPIKSVGVSLTNDRFGNKESAAQIHGHPNSYINLGTSDLLKSKKITIAMWVNIQTHVYHGRGYPSNPLIIVKNGPGEDFVNAYYIGYAYTVGRFNIEACRDSLTEVNTHSKDTVQHNAWYHLAITSDNNYLTFYVNGRVEEKMVKGFESVFHKGDSVVIGRTTDSKNQRYTHAFIDDICIYNRVLSEQEIEALCEEPNPNRLKSILAEVVKYGGIVFILGVIIMALLIRNKRNLKRQKEYYELKNRVKELEAKAIRSQMNPHFISNSMAAIQNLIYNQDYVKASQYLAKATFLMRQVLDLYDKTYISLEEELSFMKLNVELEQLRFDTNFSFKIEVEDGIDVRQVLIPALITQPFIENAIWHGLLPLKERPPRLSIYVYMENSNIFIDIEDNGIGRSEAGTETGKSSKGIKLIMDKIESINQLRNSADFKLEILDLFDESGSPAGTKISIQLLNYTQET